MSDLRSEGLVAIARALLDSDPSLNLPDLASLTARAGGVTTAEARSRVAHLYSEFREEVAPSTRPAQPATPAPAYAPGEVSGQVDLLTVLLERWRLAQDKVREYEQRHLMGHELFWRTLSVHSAQLLGQMCSPYWTRVAESEREDLARVTRVLDGRAWEGDR